MNYSIIYYKYRLSGITPQRTDSHPCTRPPSWGTSKAIARRFLGVSPRSIHHRENCQNIFTRIGKLLGMQRQCQEDTKGNPRCTQTTRRSNISKSDDPSVAGPPGCEESPLANILVPLCFLAAVCWLFHILLFLHVWWCIWYLASPLANCLAVEWEQTNTTHRSCDLSLGPPREPPKIIKCQNGSQGHHEPWTITLNSAASQHFRKDRFCNTPYTKCLILEPQTFRFRSRNRWKTRPGTKH